MGFSACPEHTKWCSLCMPASPGPPALKQGARKLTALRKNEIMLLRQGQGGPQRPCCGTVLPGPPSLPPSLPTYVRILSQAALSHPRLIASPSGARRQASENHNLSWQASFTSALPEAADSLQSEQESLPT